MGVEDHRERPLARGQIEGAAERAAGRGAAIFDDRAGQRRRCAALLPASGEEQGHGRQSGSSLPEHPPSSRA
jgi:hypothetical protein